MSKVIFMLLAPLVLLHVFYLIAVIKKNLSVIDTAWSLGFIAIALTGVILNHAHNFHELIVSILIMTWGLRLAFYLHLRNHGKPEDFRYANWRKQWGKKTNLIAYFKVYWLQYFLMLIVALPIFAVHTSTSVTFYFYHYLGIVIWLVGLIWETVADNQKSVFKSNRDNLHKVFQGGLWKFSRHPNYFGESLLWWGIGLVAFNPDSAWSLFGPLFITILLWKVSGVPLVEKRQENNPEYQKYASHTPVLIPSLSKILSSMKKNKPEVM